MNQQYQIENALKALQEGGVILYPTDTVWGLGCDATNDAAVERLLAIKERQNDQGLIVLVERDSRLNRHVEEVPAVACYPGTADHHLPQWKRICKRCICR